VEFGKSSCLVIFREILWFEMIRVGLRRDRKEASFSAFLFLRFCGLLVWSCCFLPPLVGVSFSRYVRVMSVSNFSMSIVSYGVWEAYVKIFK